MEREREREERDREREMEQREKEAEYYSAWEKQEDTVSLTIQEIKLRIIVDTFGNVKCWNVFQDLHNYPPVVFFLRFDNKSKL